MGRKCCQILKEPARNCQRSLNFSQSGEILPILVTLNRKLRQRLFCHSKEYTNNIVLNDSVIRTRLGHFNARYFCPLHTNDQFRYVALMGCHGSSVDSSLPSILCLLQPRVRIPSTPSLFFIINLIH